ncbi:MAG: UDP-N-acetylmuramoyl-tripeptide--D-alanyl-D-alanine ligase, partial [bacterium]
DLECKVVGITGSNGKTTVKDICRVLLGESTHASRENRNTEIGVPLTILEAPADTEFLICEMGMRGAGQITELCEIAEPDVGVVTNVGPVHLELLGSIEAIAAAKAEMLAGIKGGGTAVVPADAGYLGPHLGGELEPSTAEGVEILRFGPGGDVFAGAVDLLGGGIRTEVEARGETCELSFPFSGEHNLLNALAAISVGIALEVDLATMARRAPGVVFSRLRGELVRLTGGSVLINDCYNANPVSMRAALDHLSTFDADRHLSVLGEMRELGPDADRFHSEVAGHAREVGVVLLIGVGELAKSYEADQWFATAQEAATGLAEVMGANDAVLVKGSRSVGLEAVADRLTGEGP